MPDTPTFVVNDRRKFTAEGELRHDSPSGSASTGPLEAHGGPQLVPDPQATATQGPEQAVLDISTPALEQLTDLPESGVFDQSLNTAADTDPYANDASLADEIDPSLAPGPTAEDAADALRAYQATVDRLDTALRAADPGGERMPPMSFERLTQSLYTQALLLLGGGTQPGEQPRIDVLGARQTIDMLAVVAEKSAGNLTPDEDRLLQSALFDLRMGFLEITQALARQAAQRQPTGPGLPGMPPIPGAGGPRIVR